MGGAGSPPSAPHGNQGTRAVVFGLLHTGAALAQLAQRKHPPAGKGPTEGCSVQPRRRTVAAQQRRRHRQAPRAKETPFLAVLLALPPRTASDSERRGKTFQLTRAVARSQ